MSRYTGPVIKKQRRFGLLPESPADQSQRGGGRRRRKSDYGIRLEEKQKLKFIYGLQEKQFRRYFAFAQRDPKNTGIVLLQKLETRLDNMIYRIGFSPTRQGARQLVTHGHVLVNDKKVDIPSYNVSEGDVITLKEKSLTMPGVVESLEMSKTDNLPDWVKREGPVGKMDRMPTADDLRDDVDIQLIIEYYSR